MQRASRIFSILLGIAITFLLWPVAVPLGFGEVWWASQQAQSQSDVKPVPSETPPEIVPPPPAPPAQAAIPLPAPAPEQHAVEPSASSSEPAEPSNTAKAEQSAALEDKDKPAAPAPPTATKLYYRITVRDGRTLQSGGVAIKLSGLAARNADATCKSAKGKTWPCGAEAKAALTRLIRTRAVSCEVPKGKEQKEIVARCSVAGADLSIWMVRQGWAEPQDANEPALAEASKAAKQDKLGLWRGAD
jgi:endonuclease YncB( thermonuclease family)